MSRYGILQCSKTSMRVSDWRCLEGMKLMVEPQGKLREAAKIAEKLKEWMEVNVAKVSRIVVRLSESVVGIL